VIGAKRWYQSRTIWVGVLTVIAAVVSALALPSAGWREAVLAGLGAVMVVLRRITARPIAPSDKPPGPRLTLLLLLLLPLAVSACAGWKDAAVRSLWIGHDVGVGAERVAVAACRPVLAECIAAKTNPCPALEACQAKRRTALAAVESLQRSLRAALTAVEVAQEPTAAKAIAAVLSAARDVCGVLRAWSLPVAACDLLGGAR